MHAPHTCVHAHTRTHTETRGGAGARHRGAGPGPETHAAVSPGRDVQPRGAAVPAAPRAQGRCPGQSCPHPAPRPACLLPSAPGMRPAFQELPAPGCWDPEPQAPPQLPRVSGTEASPFVLVPRDPGASPAARNACARAPPLRGPLSVPHIRVASVQVSVCPCVRVLVHVARGDAVACMRAQSWPWGVRQAAGGQTG